MGFSQLAYDGRHAFRRLTRARIFTATVVAVLALGIAANVAVFSIANAVLLRPPAFPDPDRIVAFQTIAPAGADSGASPVMYFLLPDVANAFVAGGTSMAWIVRSTMPPTALSQTLQRTLQEATGLPVSNVRSMDEIVRHSISRQRFAMWMMGAFGVAALLLAAIGLYGLVACSVAQGTREIGIRLALGADATRVKRMVFKQGFRLTVAGATIGSLAALVLTRLIARFLFDVRASDPTTFIGVLIVIVGVAALAVWVPARRASRVDPIVALRYE